MHVTKKLALGLGTAALSLALVGGIAAAAFTPADAQAHDEKGKPPGAKIEAILKTLIGEGKLTEVQKDAILARLKEATEKEAAEKVGAKRPSFQWKSALGDHLKGVAAFLGLTERELAAALREGKSLADVASAKGKTRAALITAITTPANAKVDEALAAKKIDAEQAAKAKAEIAKHVETLVDRKHDAKTEPKRDEKKPEPKRDEKKTGVDVHRLLGSAHRLAATHLGLTETALGEQLRSGKSLAEIAGADAKPETTGETLIAAISAPAAAKITELKAAGTLTEAQAAAATAQLKSAAQKIVGAKRDIRKGDSPAKPKQP
ncbi:MAG: hypothetical protein M3Q61_05565 [Chloroflexota bacterium]|nr:hypothetical protein [Chloroflexota bacterium]